jgi:2,3-bisphosphoglycerate-independent phosphoglycerate mutase
MTPKENTPTNFVCLVVMDGWGMAAAGPGNAVSLANTVNFNRFWTSCPHTQLSASGEAVGLPRGEVGNTETGHLNLGAGRIVYQDLERINMAIADGTFFENPELLNAIAHAKKNNSKLHFIGLVGAAGVHSNLEHLFALLKLAKDKDFKNVFIHVITDGRDSPPTSSITYINKVREVIKKDGVGVIASVMGRYWAMDRDRRWSRTAKAYFALTQGIGNLVKTPEEAINTSYTDGKTDEFIEPAVITDAKGSPLGLIKDNDAVIFFNFRIDRPRQLSAAFIDRDFSNQSVTLDFDPFMDTYEKTHLVSKIKTVEPVFDRGKALDNLYFVTMTEYSKSLVAAGAHVAITPEVVGMPIGRVLSEKGLMQLKMAESEKERFVTFYFNGLRDLPFFGEDKIIVPSPNVPTYDQKPEMSAYEVTDQFLARMQMPNEYSFILINFANPDMVGHTGNIGPATRACEVVDECVGKIANFVLAYGGTLLITADHGNVEVMIDAATGQIDTEHNVSPVPFIVVSQKFLGNPRTLSAGILADVAPTVLSLLKIDIPSAMTGRNLLKELERA